MLAAEWNLEDALVVEREEGREDGRRETAKALKEMGVSMEMITKSTKLSPEVIAAL